MRQKALHRGRSLMPRFALQGRSDRHQGALPVVQERVRRQVRSHRTRRRACRAGAGLRAALRLDAEPHRQRSRQHDAPDRAARDPVFQGENRRIRRKEMSDCNCSICRRSGALWAYYSPKRVRFTSAGATDIYMWNERMIEFHRCKVCGSLTHWLATKRDHDRMGVNARMMPPDVVARARVRRFDGADTWKELP